MNRRHVGFYLHVTGRCTDEKRLRAVLWIESQVSRSTIIGSSPRQSCSLCNLNTLECPIVQYSTNRQHYVVKKKNLYIKFSFINLVCGNVSLKHLGPGNVVSISCRGWSMLFNSIRFHEEIL